jgi:hypothetical protein
MLSAVRRGSGDSDTSIRIRTGASGRTKSDRANFRVFPYLAEYIGHKQSTATYQKTTYTVELEVNRLLFAL